MKNIFTTFLVVVTFLGIALSQPTVDFSLTPTQLVQDVLAGPGVQISNAQFNDNPNYTGNRIGKFTYTGTQISFPGGIVMGSGGVANPAGTANGIIGPNSSGSYSMAGTGSTVASDAELSSVLGGTLRDIARLEFDFVPVGNKVSFEFIFGSDEYNEYVCSGFFDVFGFFVTGPNPGGGNYTNQNLALVPNSTLPISINTINNGSSGSNGSGQCPSGGLANSQYFAGAPGAHFQMDGATKALTIEFDVICGESYHFKFAIADVGDGAFDSWVFLKAGSFSSEAVQVSVATVSGDDTVIEGCTQADIIFTRPTNQSDTAMTVIYELGGNAIEGVDYHSLPNPIQFNPGEDSLIISLIPIQDGVVEGVDSVIITTKIVNQCGDTIVSSGTIYIVDSLEIFTTANNPIAYCVNDSIEVTVTASGGVPPFTYQWSNGATSPTTNVPVGLTGSYEHYVVVTDACGFMHRDTSLITLNQALQIDTIISGPSESCIPTGFASGYVSGFSGTPQYTWIGPSNNPDTVNTKDISNIGSGWYYFTVTDNMCSAMDSVYIDVIAAPQAIIAPNITEGCNPTTFTLSNESVDATSYKWNTGSGYYDVSSKNAQTVTLTTSSNVYLIATSGSCSDTTSITLTIANCGCTDATAINFDETATKDDGSCIYHGPEIVLPNVFTPNGDNGNDTYQFIAQNYIVEIEYWIFNRWGNIMFHTTQLNTYWDGQVNGNKASEGVYFIKYVATGLNGEEINGHTFFHLLR